MMMPRLDGLSLAREIKGRADLPIIVLSAIDAGDSKADILDEIAEDYVTKPYHYPELRARVNRVLRRLGDRVPRRSLVLGPDVVLELHRRQAIVSGASRSSSRPTESRLLYALVANLGQVVTTETLLARGWAETEDADPSYVWVTMRRLRTKLEPDPNHPAHLLTVRGVGYRLVAIGDPGPPDGLGPAAGSAPDVDPSTRRARRRRAAEPGAAPPAARGDPAVDDDRGRRRRGPGRDADDCSGAARHRPRARARRRRDLVPDPADDRPHRRGGPAARLVRARRRRGAAAAARSREHRAAAPAPDDRHRRAARGPRRVRPRVRPDRAAPGDRRGRRPGLDRRPEHADRGHRRRRARPPGREPQPARGRAGAAQPRARADPRGARRGLAARRGRLAGRPGRRRCPVGLRDGRRPDPPRRPGRRPGRGARSRARRCPVRADVRAGDDRLGVLVGHLPATRALGAGRPGPPGAVRQRDRGGRPERPAVRAGRRPERPAPRARRGQGRLPARGQPQPPDAADEHPRLRRAARGRAPGPSARDHRRAGRAAQPDGPPAADGQPPRGRHAPAARSRCSPSPRASGGPGRRSA